MANAEPTLDLVFHALADPTRRAVVARLTRGEATVSDLAAPFDMALPSFVQHLRVLESSGLVDSRKVGRVRYCRLLPAPLDDARTWIGAQRVSWERRLDRLDRHLQSMTQEPPLTVPPKERK